MKKGRKIVKRDTTIDLLTNHESLSQPIMKIGY